MGKFFEAMQRATGAEPEKKKAVPKTTVPELDDALLSPEDANRDDVFRDIGPRTPVITEPDVPKDHETDQPSVGKYTSPDSAEENLDPAEGEDYSTPIIRPADRDQFRLTLKSTGADGSESYRTESVPVLNPFPTQIDTNVYRSPIHAAYERIIQRLVSFRRGPQQGVILFSSAVAGEGTSTVARQTAIGLGGRERQQVLLVDANLRTPSQHKIFGAEREPGLTDVLLGAMSITKAIQTDRATEIDLLTAGSRVPSPAKALSASALEGVVMAVLSIYDWIIFDSPPVTSYPDATSIAEVCGGAVLVVHAERTRSEVVEETKRKIENSGVGVLGAVLNRRRYHIPGFIYNRL